MFVALGLLLLVALAGGTFWGIKRLQSTYSAAEPMTFPEVTTAWQEGTAEHAAADAETDATQPEPLSAPATAQPTARPEYVETVAPDIDQQWRAFEKAANKRQKAQIELNAAEINTLLNNNPELRGKAYVAIRDNVGHVKVSIPLDDILRDANWAQSVLGIEGRYLNGEVTIEPAPDGDPTKARIGNVRISGQEVGDDWLDRQMFGLPSARMAIADWLADQNLQTFDIRNNRVYAETR